MLRRLFPSSIDNSYEGKKVALWLFGLVVLLKIGISISTIFNGRWTASTDQLIPIDTFSPPAAQAFLSMFALWALAELLICLMCIVVLLRYRAIIPFAFGMLLVEHLSRKLLLVYMPLPIVGTPRGYFINLAILSLMIIGAALSLWPRSKPS